MKRALIGAGGFADEVKAYMGAWRMTCFVDDEYYIGKKYTRPMSEFDVTKFEVMVAVGDPQKRYDIVQRLPKETKYFSFLRSLYTFMGSYIYGEGTFICPGTIVTSNISIGNHAHLNLHTTIGHDCVIGDYFTTAPGAKISGNCTIGDRVYVGTNASIKEKINICSDVTIGLNAGVVSDITEPGVYIGTPAKRIK